MKLSVYPSGYWSGYPLACELELLLAYSSVCALEYQSEYQWGCLLVYRSE